MAVRMLSWLRLAAAQTSLMKLTALGRGTTRAADWMLSFLDRERDWSADWQLIW